MKKIWKAVLITAAAAAVAGVAVVMIQTNRPVLYASTGSKTR